MSLDSPLISMEKFMSKVRIHFPKRVEWAGRIIEAGENEFDTEKESPGFVARCLKRGCSIVEAKEEKREEKEEEKKEEEKKPRKKKSKKKEE